MLQWYIVKHWTWDIQIEWILSWVIIHSSSMAWILWYLSCLLMLKKKILEKGCKIRFFVLYWFSSLAFCVGDQIQYLENSFTTTNHHQIGTPVPFVYFVAFNFLAPPPFLFIRDYYETKHRWDIKNLLHVFLLSDHFYKVQHNFGKQLWHKNLEYKMKYFYNKNTTLPNSL